MNCFFTLMVLIWLHLVKPGYTLIYQILTESGYSILRQDRNECQARQVKSKGGGLLLYVKECYSDFISKLDINNPLSHNLEHMWLSIEIPHRRKIIMGICYRPPSGNVSTAINTISTTLDSLDVGEHKDLLIVGDFNINYNNRNSLGFKELKDLERKYLVKQKIVTPTRICHKSKSLIDLIFTNIDNICSTGTYDVGISDHLPIYMIVKKVRLQKQCISIKGRIYKNYNRDIYQKTVKSHCLWYEFWKQKMLISNGICC